MKKTTLTASFLVSTCLTATAYGQSVNYNDLQELFGEPVTTSATGKPQRSSEAPASMVIITADELRRSGATTLPEILQNYAGIDVNNYVTGQSDVTVRGANIPLSPRLLVLVNGRQVYLDHFGYTDWNLIGVELSEIQQVEVVKGPNSALFGFNAVSGVVNIITIDPLARSKTTVSANYGNKGQVAGSFAVATKLSDKVGVRLSAGYREEDEWSGISQPAINFTLSDKPVRNYNVGGELTWQVASNVRASADYTYSRAKQVEQGFVGRVIQSDTELKGVNGTVAIDSSLGLLKAQVYYNDLTHNYDSAGVLYSMQDTVFVAKLEDMIKVNAKHSVRLGAEYRRNEYEMLTAISSVTAYDVYSANAMWEWAITDSLAATNAVRLDRMELDYTPADNSVFYFDTDSFENKFSEWSYNSSLSYEADPKTRIRFSAMRGIHIPAARSLAMYVLPLGTFNLGFRPSEDTSPGSDTSYELAFNRNIDAINGKASIALSANSTKGFQAFGVNTGSAVGAPIPTVIDNALGDFKSYTIEASLEGKFSTVFDWMLNYTWTDVQEKFTSDRLSDVVAMGDGTPAHKVNAVLSYQEGPWEAFMAARYRSKTTQNPAPFNTATTDDLVRLAGNVTVDARVAYTFKDNWTVSLAGQNLTGNNSAGLNAFNTADTRVRVGLSAEF
jgi:iron complex outermembrane receptor protein